MNSKPLGGLCQADLGSTALRRGFLLCEYEFIVKDKLRSGKRWARQGLSTESEQMSTPRAPTDTWLRPRAPSPSGKSRVGDSHGPWGPASSFHSLICPPLEFEERRREVSDPVVRVGEGREPIRGPEVTTCRGRPGCWCWYAIAATHSGRRGSGSCGPWTTVTHLSRYAILRDYSLLFFFARVFQLSSSDIQIILLGTDDYLHMQMRQSWKRLPVRKKPSKKC